MRVLVSAFAAVMDESHARIDVTIRPDTCIQCEGYILFPFKVAQAHRHIRMKNQYFSYVLRQKV